MDLDKLKTFYFVALEGSIKKAESHLGIKSSFISKQISALEKDLNTKLFKRHYRGLSLTEAGQNLLASAQHIMNEVEKISSSFKRHVNEKLKGSLRMLTTNGVTSYHAMDLINKYVSLYPDINVKVNCELSTIEFRDYQADIALLPRPTPGSDYVNKKVFDAKTYLYAMPSYLQRFGQPQRVEDLVNHRLIAYCYEKLAQTYGADFHIQIVKKIYPDFQPYMVINSLTPYFYSGYLGLGIIQMWESHPFLNQLGFVKILPEMGIDVSLYFSYPVSSAKLKKIQAFEHILGDNYEE